MNLVTFYPSVQHSPTISKYDPKSGYLVVSMKNELYFSLFCNVNTIRSSPPSPSPSSSPPVCLDCEPGYYNIGYATSCYKCFYFPPQWAIYGVFLLFLIF